MVRNVDKFIPVVVINNFSQIKNIFSAFLEKGFNSAEITFRSEYAANAIAYGVSRFPHMNIGAGTILNSVQCETALKAGAKFIVSPGLSKDVAMICKQNGIPYYPGCVTPTEIMEAAELGIKVVKFFPSSVYGGINAIKAFRGPFPQIKFIPSGGISRENLDEYLALDNVVAVGGSFFVDEALNS